MMIVDALAVLTQSFVLKVPALIYAIVFLVIGYVVGKTLGYVVKRALEEAKIDKYVSHKHFKFEVSGLTAVIVRWVVYLIFIQQATNILGVTVISGIVNQIIGFIPGIVGAAAVIIAADGIGIYIKDYVIGTTDVYTKIAGHLTFFLVLYVGIATALPLIGINPILINQILLLIVGSVAVGMAIALGLGLKDTVRDLSKEYIVVKKKK
ncbi:MAG: hypothetical protein K0B02_04980 [DPANN group archaeon]|nr:hypothetical protein [DPANN group archaeon]